MNLSPTKISTFEDCSMKFNYRYNDRWKPKKDSANLAFGRSIHAALEGLFNSGASPIETFKEEWEAYKDTELKYSKYDTWDKLMSIGVVLMDLFLKEEAGKFKETYAVEDWLKFPINAQADFWGRGDWIGKVELDGNVINAIVDFKTASRQYDENQANMNDQLTAYYHARKKYPFPIEKVIFVVFVKTKAPKIQWIIGKRTEEQVQDYLAKVREYNDRICRDSFFKEYGMQCNWCDYQPLCLGDEKRIREELIQEIEEEEAI